MKKLLSLAILMLMPILTITACNEVQQITNFDECIAAGNPALESYPRQCQTPAGQIFVEEIPEVEGISSEEINQTEAQLVAKKWIEENSETYRFDGSDLVLKDEVSLSRCQNCYAYVFLFNSEYLGYGDRSNLEDLENTKVTTPHKITVVVENGRITQTITDEEYDEIKHERIKK